MTPINDAVARDRIARLREQADQRRIARLARQAQRPLREAVGHGLIALGARLVDTPLTDDQSRLGQAA